MCGIAGFYGKGDLVDLKKMTDVLRKRGPDMEGTFVSGPLFMGHRRLSIIDLSEHGRQPVSNEDGTIWITYNGEIYNFQELKKDLLAKGHKFKSHSDTEVIIHLYEDMGTEALARLNGMFAFALWDGRNKKLILGRDRMGEKPLFYAMQNGNLFFASEARAIVRHSHFAARMDINAMAKYLMHEHVPTPDAIWEDMNKLPPATVLIYDTLSKKITFKEYWKLTFLPKIHMGLDDYVDELGKRIELSVKRRLIADVPIGIFMSGGLDSTTIAYYAQKFASEPVKTFSIGFSEESFNELPQARIAARSIGSRHHEIVMSSDMMYDLIFEVIEQLDEPFADSSIIPYYYLSKISRKDVTVAIGGDGGDELFVGYLQLKANDLIRWYRLLPRTIRKNLLIPLIWNIPSTFKKLSWEYKLKKFIEADDYADNPFRCQKVWMGAFIPKYLSQLFTDPGLFKKVEASLFEEADSISLKTDPGEEMEDRILRMTQHQYLMDDGLIKVDRSSMMNSLEVRSPFLDHELVEWINRVPYRIKFHRGQYKYLFKKLVGRILPKELLNLPKRGFTPPISEWFIQGYRKTVEDIMFSGDDEMFNKKFLRKIWDEHLNRKFDHRKTLWTFLVWKIWSDKHLKTSC